MINEEERAQRCTMPAAVSGNMKSARTAVALKAVVAVSAGLLIGGVARVQGSVDPASTPVRRGQGMEGGMRSPADMMMGGNPSSNLVAGAGALRGVTNEIKTPMPDWANGLIKLDPICETIEPPSPKFPPGNPAPSTRRMAPTP